MSIIDYNNKDSVLEASKKRISFIFDNFEKIIVSISGGKDSTVLCHLLLQEAKLRDRKIGIFFFDEEVVYQSTINQIEYLMNLCPENTIRMWMQIEFNLTNAVSYKESYLKAWDKKHSDKWMRSRKRYAIIAPQWDIKSQIILNKKIGLDFYSVLANFENLYENTAFFVGLRSQESLHRWRAVTKNSTEINGKNIYWITKKKNNCISVYPLYDWAFSDVWKYIYDNKLKYSKMYDYMYKKGYNIPEIRISSLIHEKSFKSICDLPEFEPKTYEKLCNRIHGIKFAQETGKNPKMFKVNRLPKNYKTWKEYRDFLLQTYPDKEKKNIFIRRFSNHQNNEYIAKQQCRQLILNDYENNLPIENKDDPRIEIIKYYRSVL